MDSVKQDKKSRMSTLALENDNAPISNIVIYNLILQFYIAKNKELIEKIINHKNSATSSPSIHQKTFFQNLF